MWIPSEDWIQGALCGAECYEQFAALHQPLSEEGLRQIAEAYAEDFYPMDVVRGKAFADGFVHGYAGRRRMDAEQSDEENRE